MSSEKEAQNAAGKCEEIQHMVNAVDRASSNGLNQTAHVILSELRTLLKLECGNPQKTTPFRRYSSRD
jgi:Asp-tRNA(Asn)/Glu-tRNA(Gln) amidotransferase C subunit